MENQVSRFTKQQRHKIYKEALSLLKLKQSNIHSMCCYIGDATRRNGLPFSMIHVLDDFPEMVSIKPKATQIDSLPMLYGFWWDCSDKNIRIEMFEKIIKMAE